MKQVSFTGITALIFVADFPFMKLNVSKIHQIANCCRKIGNIYKLILISHHLQIKLIIILSCQLLLCWLIYSPGFEIKV